MMDYSNIAARNLKAVRQAVPLVHVITNHVTVGWVADVLCAVGAAPVMADDAGEVEEVTARADALVLNLGTLNPARFKGIRKAGQTATAIDLPIVLDPVGAGAIAARTAAALEVVNLCRISVVRANASEMRAVSGQSVRARGVDSGHPVEAARVAAGKVAAEYKLVSVVTGPEDLVTDGGRTFRVANGHKLMGRISGTGCAVGAVIGVFLAVDSDPLRATLSALACFDLAGEMAAEKTRLPGTYKTALLDALDQMTPAMLQQGARITDGDPD